MSIDSTNPVLASRADGVRPRQAAPDLTVALRSGGTYRLAGQQPESYTMVVFFRGLHWRGTRRRHAPPRWDLWR